MRIKRIFILLLLLAGISISEVFFYESKAMEANYTDFSAYINCFKNDYYTSEVIISPLTRNNKYNIGSKCYAKYNTKDITGTPKLKNYGFKINNEFYVSSVTLKKSGNYIIEVFPYEKINNIIKAKESTSLETFSITVDLAFEVTLNKTIYSYDAYDSANNFIESIKSNFNQQITISTESDTLIRNTYKFCKENKAKRTINIKVFFRNVEYSFSITITNSSDGAKKNFIDIEQKKENIKYIATMYNTNYKNSSAIDYLRSLINSRIIADLELSPEQSVTIDYLNNPTYPILNSVEKQIIMFEIKIQDTIIDTNYTNMTLYMLIYQPSFITKNNLFVDFSSNKYLESQEYLNVTKTYLAFDDSENNLTFYDYQINLDISGKINTETNELIYKLKYNSIEINQILPIEIVKNQQQVKIVTNYNYIVLSKKESLEYKSQVGVLVNNTLIKSLETKDYYFLYDIQTEDNYDYLKISLYDAENNSEIESKTIRIVYKNSKKQNIFEKFLENYGKFLKNAF